MRLPMQRGICRSVTHIKKSSQHTQKNKSIQEQLNPEDSTSISSALENIASGLHVRGQKVELQSIKVHYIRW